MAGETVTGSRAASTFPIYANAGNNVHTAWAIETFATTEQQALDVKQMVRVPKGGRVLGGFLYSDDIDTDGTPAVTLHVGDGVDPDRYLASATVGQGGGAVMFGRTATLMDYVYTEDDTIDVQIAVVPDTAASGKIGIVVFYTVDQL